MAASIAAEPEGARLKGVVLGRAERRRDRVQPHPRPTRSPADALAYVGFEQPRRHPDPGLPAGAGEPRRRGAAASSRALSGAAAAAPRRLARRPLGPRRGRARPRRDRRAPRRAPRSRCRWRTAPRRRRRSTSCASGSRRSCKTFSPDTTIPKWQPVPLAGGVQGWRLPLSPEAGVVYGVDGDLAIVGTSVPAVTSVQRPVAPLSESAAFQAGHRRDARRGHLGPLGEPPGAARRPAQARAPSTDATPRRSPTCGR